MAELLTYSQSLTSMTGGRGDYSMHFLRYEEVPDARRAEDHRGDEARARGGEGLSSDVRPQPVDNAMNRC